MRSIVGGHWVKAIALSKVLKKRLLNKENHNIAFGKPRYVQNKSGARAGGEGGQEREINVDYVHTKNWFHLHRGMWRSRQCGVLAQNIK